VDVLLGPGVNIKRTPLCGRNFEYFSEDPYVAGMFGKSFIEGVQSGHVGTSLKHYCCNNREYARNWISSEIDERTMREIYLKPFEIAVKAKPWTVMTSYNLVNGVRMSANKKLNDVLRNEFGFDGVIVSDWGAVKDPLDSLHAELDLEFPHNAKHATQMQEHLEAGRVDQECLDKCSGHIIALGEKATKEKALRQIQYTEEERIAISQEIEEEGIVLLKNNGVLPLKKETLCVTGLPAKKYYFGGGSSAVKPNRPFVPLDEALENLGYEVHYTESTADSCGTYVIMGNIGQACLECAKSDVTIFAVGTGANVEVEATDRQDITLTSEELSTLRYLRKYAKKLVVVVYAGSAVDLSQFDELADAVVLAGFGGQNVSQAVANVLTGKVNPSGRLTETYAYSIKDIPAEQTYRDEAVMVYEEKLNVGYRYFTTHGVDVLYPFGYGLSYSEFQYSDLKVKKTGDRVTVSVQVENISDTDGKEVVQLYVNEEKPAVSRPKRELKAFAKVAIKAHETAEVTFELTESAFSYYAQEQSKWTVNPGAFLIEIGKNANEMILSESVEYGL
jgi:beta-glucosidase